MTGHGRPSITGCSSCTLAAENWRCWWMVPTSSIVRFTTSTFQILPVTRWWWTRSRSCSVRGV
ncbi:hypothetical protein AB205_0200840 [Aquarana catesbeiana]|uniref:Uncharacterized protein n=1 Tax=Aquarana catesbeiana TaxID=8400 RepID=A0A2G9RMI8_AQUCT|nr:hypothetical protein AB205_0200840 [Aquarana catesbeiana]